MGNYSKAPWRACNDGDCSCGLIWSVADDVCIAHVLSSADEDYTGGEGVVFRSPKFKANANLLAAAPELYESVQNLLGIFNSPMYRRKFNGMATEAIELAKIALYKADTGVYPPKEDNKPKTETI